MGPLSQMMLLCAEPHSHLDVKWVYWAIISPDKGICTQIEAQGGVMKKAIVILLPLLGMPSMVFALGNTVYSPYSASSAPLMFNPSNPSGSIQNGFNTPQQAYAAPSASAIGAAPAGPPSFIPAAAKPPVYQGGPTPATSGNPYYNATCSHVSGPNMTVATQYVHCSYGGAYISSRACRFTDPYHAYEPYPIDSSQPFVKPIPPDCYFVPTQVNVGLNQDKD